MAKIITRKPKVKSSTDSSYLPEDQQRLLTERFVKAWSDSSAVLRFTVQSLQVNLPVELSSGWRSRPFYCGDAMYLADLRVTKRNGIVFKFRFDTNRKTIPIWAVKEGFKQAELTYDKAVEVFGPEFANEISEVMGQTWESAIAEMALPTSEALSPTEPPAKRPIELLADWGSW